MELCGREGDKLATTLGGISWVDTGGGETNKQLFLAVIGISDGGVVDTSDSSCGVAEWCGKYCSR